MTYPRIPHDKKRSVKLTLTDIKDIRKSYKFGKTMTELSERYGVCWDTIKYWTDEDYRQKKIREVYNRQEIRLKHDPIFKQITDQQKKEFFKRRRKEREFKDYMNELRRKNPEKYKNYIKKSRSLHKEGFLNTQKRYREKNKEKIYQWNNDWQKKNRKIRSEYQKRLYRAKTHSAFKLMFNKL